MTKEDFRTKLPNLSIVGWLPVVTYYVSSGYLDNCRYFSSVHQTLPWCVADTYREKSEITAALSSAKELSQQNGSDCNHEQPRCF